MGPLRGVTLRVTVRDGKKSCAEGANIRSENGPSMREVAKKEKEVRVGFAVATGTVKVTKLPAQRVLTALGYDGEGVRLVGGRPEQGTWRG